MSVGILLPRRSFYVRSRHNDDEEQTMARINEYKQVRNYLNLQKGMYRGAGEYDIPVLKPVKEISAEDWIPFNYARTRAHPERDGVHFFIDDYQFERVWLWPSKYLPMLSRFSVVCTPDFSPYADFPKAVQVFNHYRKHWCGAYWQEHGITVIPTITWSSPDTLEWALDGEPVGGVVATSSVGMLGSDETKEWLLNGYGEMLDWLKPVKVLWKGKVPDELEADVKSGLIYKLPQHNDKWRSVDGG